MKKTDLQSDSLEGRKFGPSSISLILTVNQPGEGPRLHRHPYDETWVIQEGKVRIWIGDEVGEVGRGDLAFAPPNTAHKFKNVGVGVAKLVCIHANPTFVTEWLE
jgi:mannose-6-phosphate isomerase-like protein (cupin superfamily)